MGLAVIVLIAIDVFVSKYLRGDFHRDTDSDSAEELSLISDNGFTDKQ